MNNSQVESFLILQLIRHVPPVVGVPFGRVLLVGVVLLSAAAPLFSGVE